LPITKKNQNHRSYHVQIHEPSVSKLGFIIGNYATNLSHPPAPEPKYTSSTKLNVMIHGTARVSHIRVTTCVTNDLLAWPTIQQRKKCQIS
jgi:hypothetical protein